MAAPKADKNSFATVWMDTYRRGGTANDVAAVFGYEGLRNVMGMRRRTEKALGISLPSLGGNGYTRPENANVVYIEEKKPFDLVISSDHHMWPPHIPPAFGILMQVLQDIKPKHYILNGDAIDFPACSKFLPSTLDETPPLVEEEIEHAQKLMGELHGASPRTKKLWTRGNHCIRYERYLLSKAPAVARVQGNDLRSKFPRWNICDIVFVNETLVVKHTIKSGIYCNVHNPKQAGMSTATGHTHRLNARPVTDYTGMKWGIETGFIGDVRESSGVWAYTDNNPLDWQSGFMVLHIDQADIYPEPVHVLGNKTRFRGKTYRA